MTIDWPEFDEKKYYTALEWLGWQKLTEKINHVEVCLLDNWAFSDAVNDEEATALYRVFYEKDALSFIDYCSDRAELELWWDKIDKYHQSFLDLHKRMARDGEIYGDDFNKLLESMSELGTYPVNPEFNSYYNWAIKQLKSGTRLHELPGWEEDDN